MKKLTFGGFKGKLAIKNISLIFNVKVFFVTSNWFKYQWITKQWHYNLHFIKYILWMQRCFIQGFGSCTKQNKFTSDFFSYPINKIKLFYIFNLILWDAKYNIHKSKISNQKPCFSVFEEEFKHIRTFQYKKTIKPLIRFMHSIDEVPFSNLRCNEVITLLLS